MRFVWLFTLFVIVLIAVGESEAWWSSRSSSSSSSNNRRNSKSSISRSSSSRKQNAWGPVRTSAKKTLDKVKEKAKAAKDFVKGAAAGTKAMKKAYDDMKEANWKNSDKYFHARGNSDAAKHGPGGKFAAKVISNAREVYGWVKGDSAADRAADQEANEHGRNGGDPNKYRPEGLPDKYKK